MSKIEEVRVTPHYHERDFTHYYLDENKNAIGCPITTEAELEEWAMRLARHTFVDFDLIGDAQVSTVFLGIDHDFGRGGPLQLFETMVLDRSDEGSLFDSSSRGTMRRYATYAEAQQGHEEVLRETALHFIAWG